MPLRALDDGHDVIAPLLDDDAWADLRGRVRNGRTHLTFPCCGTAARLRTSKRGLKHFYHGHGSDCAAAGETMRHLVTKLAVYLACRDAGWDATTEWSEVDWRADVLARYETRRVAFEVQYARQSLDAFVERSARYRRDGVEVVWLYDHPNSLPYNYCHPEIPVFFLWCDPDVPDAPIEVFIEHVRLPLAAFVHAWLAKAIHYRTHRTATAVIQPTLLLSVVPCWRCKKWSHVYELRAEEEFFGSACGHAVYSPRNLTDLRSLAFHPQTVRAATAFVRANKTRSGWGFRLAPITQRWDGITKQLQVCFGCYHCNAAFNYDWVRGQVEKRYQRGLSIDGDVTVGTSICLPIRQEWPHWCYSDTGQVCDE